MTLVSCYPGDCQRCWVQLRLCPLKASAPPQVSWPWGRPKPGGVPGRSCTGVTSRLCTSPVPSVTRICLRCTACRSRFLFGCERSVHHLPSLTDLPLGTGGWPLFSASSVAIHWRASLCQLPLFLAHLLLCRARYSVAGVESSLFQKLASLIARA